MISNRLFYNWIFLNLFFVFFLEIIDSEDLLCARFLNSHRCYDAMPTSTKLVVFDTQLSVSGPSFYSSTNNEHISILN